MMPLLSRLFRRPKLSVVVIVYDMGREAPRTLQSLALPYQTGIAAEDYEVIVVDNGSPIPLGEAAIRAYGSNFRYRYIKNALKSPAAAVNLGVALSRAPVVGICVDGARIASPGLLSTALSAFRLHKDPIVATLAWHLGPEVQQKSVLNGYNKGTEDRLLESIRWPSDGYRLFEISVLAASSNKGYFAAPSESNALFLRRSTFHEMGGYDTAFDLPGGGLLNLDFFIRALDRKQSPYVMLLGEGTFHQIHGGASTSAEPERDRFQEWAEQYKKIRGEPWQHPQKSAIYLGHIPPHASMSIYDSAEKLREEDTA